MPNARWVEYIPQLDSLTTEAMVIRDGFAHPSAKPGLGIDWDWDSIGKARLHAAPIRRSALALLGWTLLTWLVVRALAGTHR